MGKVKLGMPRTPAPATGLALFALGFRPFFLLAGLSGVLLMGVWLAAYAGGVSLATPYGALQWHAHEMLFGYTAAVIAGFLLTAVRNWTRIPTASGGVLAALAGVWLLGRLGMALSDSLPLWLVATVDLAFLPLVAAAIAVPLVRGGQKHNLLFIPLLGGLVLANALMHLRVMGVVELAISRANGLALELVVLLMAIIGGRVIGFFTEKGLGVSVRRWQWVEYAAPLTVLALVISDLGSGLSPLTGVLALAAGGVNLLRSIGWYRREIWTEPLVWVLHLAYGWIWIGLVFRGLAAWGVVPPVLGWHALAAGGIGVLTLGMMARVSLGHTGRPLSVGRAMSAAFVLLNLAAAVRVIAPLLIPQRYELLIAVSGGLWIGAFVIFVVVYTPILLRPRVDGRPG